MAPVDDDKDEPVDDLPTETVPTEEIESRIAEMAASAELDAGDTELSPAAEIQAHVQAARDEIPTAIMPRGRVLPASPPGDDDDTLTEDDDDLDDLPTGILAQPLPPPPAAGGAAGVSAVKPLSLPLSPDELEPTQMVAIDEDDAAAYDPDFDDPEPDPVPQKQPAPAVAEPPRRDTARVPRQRRGRGLALVVSILATAAIAAGVAWYLYRDRDQPASARADAPPPTAPTDAAAVVAEPIAPPADAGPVPGEAVTVSLGRNQPAIDACVEANPKDVGSGLKVTFVLPIATDGSAPAAGIRPAALARTDLGRCLRDVARHTRFAPRDERISVSIPLLVRPR